MNTSLKRLLSGIGLTMACVAAAQAADPYPSKPIRIVANSGPGALLDATTRAVAAKMAENLGVAMFVENVQGAGGLIGIQKAKSAPADGYTILAAANTLAQGVALRREPGYELKDFVPIGIMSRAPLLMVGTTGQPDRTLAELLARARSSPETLTYASGGSGTTTHLAAAMFVSQAGVKFLHVPYKSNASAMPDVIAGRVNVIFDGANSSGPLMKEGRLRAYGITSSTRSPAFPDVPTLAEQGVPGYSFYVYLGLTAPAGTPPEVVKRLSQALQYALNSELLRERFRTEGSESKFMTPEEFGELLRQDAQSTAKVVADLGLPKE